MVLLMGSFLRKLRPSSWWSLNNSGCIIWYCTYSKNRVSVNNFWETLLIFAVFGEKKIFNYTVWDLSLYMYMHMHMHTSMHVHIYAYEYIHIYIHAYMYVTLHANIIWMVSIFIFVYFILYTLCLLERTCVAGAAVRQCWKTKQNKTKKQQKTQTQPNKTKTKPKYIAYTISFSIELAYPTSNHCVNRCWLRTNETPYSNNLW